MAALTAHALENQDFRRIVSTASITIGDRYLANHNKLLRGHGHRATGHHLQLLPWRQGIAQILRRHQGRPPGAPGGGAAIPHAPQAPGVRDHSLRRAWTAHGGGADGGLREPGLPDPPLSPASRRAEGAAAAMSTLATSSPSR